MSTDRQLDRLDRIDAWMDARPRWCWAILLALAIAANVAAFWLAITSTHPGH